MSRKCTKFLLFLSVILVLGTGMGAAAVFERGSIVDQLLNVRPISQNNFLSKDAQ